MVNKAICDRIPTVDCSRGAEIDFIRPCRQMVSQKNNLTPLGLFRTGIRLAKPHSRPFAVAASGGSSSPVSAMPTDLLHARIGR
jgi:hypothetical protein